MHRAAPASSKWRARSSRLIRSGALPRPERTIRFIWPAEIEGTIALLNARPEFARRTLATIHLDMIGGNSEITKSVLRVHGSPPSLPSFVSDDRLRLRPLRQRAIPALRRYRRAPISRWSSPTATGARFRPKSAASTQGSDHQVWAEGSWRIPVIYIADWPDRYIHTQRDLPGNLDPTKMRRAIFIAAGAGWHLASAASFEAAAEPVAAADRAVPTGPVYRRIRREGPMNGFGYSWYDDRLARAGLTRPRLLSREAGPGPSFGYEALNLVDGRRSVGEIRDELAATVGPAPLEEVGEYLDTLARLGVIEVVQRDDR